LEVGVVTKPARVERPDLPARYPGDYEPTYGSWPRRVPATWAEDDGERHPGVVYPAPVSRRRHRHGWGAVDIERVDAAQPLRTYSTPERRERAANALLTMRVSLAGLGWVALALTLLAAVLGAVALVVLGVQVVEWSIGVNL
jgi:hypothetical protein